MGDSQIVVYQPGFDTNLDMNPIGPLPRPDGSQVTQTDATGEARAGPAKKNNTSQHGRSSSSFGQEDLVGLNEGEYAFRPYSMETLDNVQSSTAIPDAETQAALEGLFMESSHHTTNHGETTSGEVGETNLDTTSADGTKKRRPGTSRINMLARGGACEFCKRRKLKCSAEEPSCSACLRANRECVYSQKKQRSKVRQLEDRLADLEKRLEPGITSQEGTPVPATLTEYAARHDPVTSDGFWNRLADIGSTTADLGFTFPGDLTGWGVNGGVLDQNGIETLMTLADAASIGQDGSAKFAWESMSEVEIASEIVKAVEGEKGVGEKIVSHLLQLYVNPQLVPYLHYAVNPRSFLSRTLPNSPSPPHPALILALVPLLLHLSPSKALSTPSRAALIAEKLDIPTRLHAQHALAIADNRMLDIVATNVIRTTQCFYNARMLEGWGQSCGAVSLAWATGIGKLGGMGAKLAASSTQSKPVHPKIIQRNERLREVSFKPTVLEPPSTRLDLGLRIDLFWQVYLQDKAPSIGWSMPSVIVDEEITTPFPRSSYAQTEDLEDERTINDFLEDRAYTGGSDSDYCAQMKGLCLLQRATRLFDLSSNVATVERTADLKRVAKGYIATLPPLNISAGAKIGPKSQAWQMLHLTLFYVYLKEELDLPDKADRHVSVICIDNAIQSAVDAVNALDALYLTGDVELEGYDLLTPASWGSSGRAIFETASRLDKEADTEGRAAQLRSLGQRVIAAFHIIGKRSPFAKFMAQKLENNARGADQAIGVYARTDILT